jgi:hypothetical protein
VLSEIDTANYQIHSKGGSEDRLSELNEEEVEAMDAWKKNDENMDVMLDEIIQGVGVVRKKVQTINQNQDEVDARVHKANKKAIALEKRIKTDN